MPDRMLAILLRAIAMAALVLIGAVLMRNITGVLTLALW
jgi:hypothetical protein